MGKYMMIQIYDNKEEQKRQRIPKGHFKVVHIRKYAQGTHISNLLLHLHLLVFSEYGPGLVTLDLVKSKKVTFTVENAVCSTTAGLSGLMLPVVMVSAAHPQHHMGKALHVHS